MKQLIAIGEALIDFVPHQSGVPLKNVEDFKGIVGGAPTNVCAAFAKLGGAASVITQLGLDAFGDKIIDELNNIGINTDMISRTDMANTCLAFVSLMNDGNRDFMFYRNPSADMLLNADQLRQEHFEDVYALHFCSVSLGDFPMKEAHKKAIEYSLASNAIISFDPNIRLPLWEDHIALKNVIQEFIPYSHVLKISDDELEFITGINSIDKAISSLFLGNVQMILYTKGSGGAEAYTRKMHVCSNSHNVAAKDTTGAGDAFIGSFLFQLYEDNYDIRTSFNEEQLNRLIEFSCRYSEYSVQRSGAVSSYATNDQMLDYIKMLE